MILITPIFDLIYVSLHKHSKHMLPVCGLLLNFKPSAAFQSKSPAMH